MKIQYLIIFLIMGITNGGAQAMSPRGGGATGGAAAQPPDFSRCDLKQRKVKLKDKEGKYHFICTGQAICGGKPIPISCTISEREICPTAKKCVEFGQGVVTPMGEYGLAMKILSLRLVNQLTLISDDSDPTARLFVAPMVEGIKFPDPPAGSKYRWIKYEQGKQIPRFSLISGIKYYGESSTTERQPDGTIIQKEPVDAQLVCRARHGGALIPGSYFGWNATKRVCYIIINKNEVIEKTDFEILERGANPGVWAWVKVKDKPMPELGITFGLECRMTADSHFGFCIPKIPSGTTVIPFNPETTGKFEDGFIGGRDEKGNPLRICRMLSDDSPKNRYIKNTDVPAGYVGEDNICYIPGSNYTKVLKFNNLFSMPIISGQNE